MTTSTLAFTDSETTSLRRDRRPWNIAVTLRADGHDLAPEEIIIRDVDLTEADPFALQVGHFWERHPAVGGDPGAAQIVPTEHDAALWLLERVQPVLRHTSDGVELCRVHIVGAVPSFDVETFVMMFARHQLMWPAHHHLIDAEVLAIGALAARGQRIDPPYSSDDVSAALGVGVGKYARHTAAGDTEWVRDLYDAAMRPA